MSRIPSIALALFGAAVACGAPKPEKPAASGTEIQQALMARRRMADQRPDSFTIAADRGRVLGDSAARVWLVIVGDFQCADCKTWHDEVFPLLRKQYVATGRVRMAFLNLPLPAHLNAMSAARAAGCAAAHGKFWETQSRIFETQSAWKGLTDPGPYLDSLAVGAGVDAATQRTCSERAQSTKLIQTDIERVRASGVDSLPTFFIGTHKLVGRAPVTTFRAVLDSALAGK